MTSSSKNYKIILTNNFYSEAKVLANKYPWLKERLLELKDKLKKDAHILGDPIADGFRKLRINVPGKTKGTSGGARVIFEVLIVDMEVYMLSIYDKASYDTAITAEIKRQLKNGQIKPLGKRRS